MPPAGTDPGPFPLIPPGPPPPPPGWVPVPVGAPWPSYPSLPGHAREAIASIRGGIRLYEVLLGLDILLALVGGAYATAVGGTYLESLSPVGGATTLDRGAGGIAFGVLSGVLGLLSLALLVLSWARWRSGLKALYAEGTEYGAEHEADVGRAHRDYTRAVAMFLLNLVGVVVVSVASALVVVGRAVSSRGSFDVRSLPSLLLPTIVAGLAFAAVFATLMYYFAGRSLAGTIRALLPADDRPPVDRGALWMAVGALVAAPAGLAALYVPGLALAAVASPAVILYGLHRIGRGYDAGLGSAAWAPPPPPVAWPMPPQ